MRSTVRKFGTILVVPLAALLTVTQAGAQVLALNAPRPYPAGCANFHQTASGTWVPNGPILVNGHIILGEGDVIGPADEIGGYKLGQWLASHCPGYAQEYQGPFAGHCGSWAGGCNAGLSMQSNVALPALQPERQP